jgi:hypothetical protein
MNGKKNVYVIIKMIIIMLLKRNVTIIMLSIFLMNCNKKKETQVQKAETDSTAMTETVVDTLGPKSFCYMEVTGKDTVFVTIDDNLGTVTGKIYNKFLY